MEARRSRIRLGAGILISLAAIAVLIWLVDARKVLSSLSQVRISTITLVLILLIISLLSRAAAWRIILQGRISLWKSFLIINSGYFVNTVLPFRLGEVTRAFLLLPSGFNFWEAFPAVVLERIFDFSFVLIIFFFTLPYALNFDQGLGFVYLLVGLVIIGLLVFLLLVRFHSKITQRIQGWSFLNDKLKSRIINLIESVGNSLKILSNPLNLLKVFLLMAFSWCIALLIQYLLLQAFLPGARLLWAAFGLSAVSLGVSIPSSPGNIGVYEASITLALSAFGIDQSLAFSYALISHILSLFVTTSLGSYGLVIEGYRLRDIWQFSKTRKKDIET